MNPYKRKMIRQMTLLFTAAVLALGPAGNAWAEGAGSKAEAAEASAPAPAEKPAQPSEETAIQPLDQAAAPPAGNTPAKPDDTPASAPGDKEDGEGNFAVTGYEIYGPGESKDTLDVIRKGRQARVVVFVRNNAMRTRDVTASSLRVSKVHDSFRGSGNPKIRITSDKDETLEFTVTFTKLTYQGKGDELKFKVTNKKDTAGAQSMTVNISECEESQNGGSSEGYTAGNPVLKVRRISPQASVKPGEKFTLILELENTSDDADIEDLSVGVNPGSGFFITDDTNSKLIKRLDTKKTEQIRLEMMAAQELSGPSQVLELELRYNYYSNGQLTPGTSSQKVIIQTAGSATPGQPVIKVSRGEIASPISANQEFNMVIRLENTSKDREIRNLTVTLEPNDQISLMDQTDTKMAGTLAAGQVIDIPVKLKAGAEMSNAASQLLGLILKFDYDSDKGTVQGTYGEKLVIPVKGGQANPAGPTPNLIIQNYTYGERVLAGQVFELEMDLTNTSSQTAVENVVMSLETGEGISINSSSNTFYIPRLSAGETRKEKVKVQALFQSKLQSPKITITCKYEYTDKKERRQTSSSETIAIPVYQPDRFELKTPVYSENMKAGEEGTISIPYVNKGRGSVFNVEAALNMEVKALEKDVSAGNFEAGKSGTLDFIITPEKAGDHRGEVIVSYEDEAMQAKTIKVPLEFTVKEPQAAEGVGDQEELSDGDTGRSRVWPAAAAAGGVAAGVLFLVVLWKRKKKKAWNNGEDKWNEDEAWDEEEDQQEDIRRETDSKTDGGKLS